MLASLYVLFFLSGVSALIYQVLWLRKLSLVFGVTVYAASTVLASFMGGLAIGSAAAGFLADRVRRPVFWFGIVELLIAGTALLSPVAFTWLTDTYIHLSGSATSRGGVLFVRLACSAAFLVPPAILMGATSPLVLRSAMVSPRAAGAHVSVLYALNTAGAIAGVLLAGFLFIGWIGMNATFRLAAAVNLVVGAAAIILSRYETPLMPAGEPERIRNGQWPGGGRSRALLIAAAFAVSGFSSLGLEVVWFRTLVLYYPATTYAFTAMLATVLTGIAAGSLAISAVLRRREPQLWWFGALHALSGLTAIGGVSWLAAVYTPGMTVGELVRGASVTILPATVAMGMAFPVGLRLLATTEMRGRQIGLLYALNLAGAIGGSLVAGFALIPSVGSARSLVFLGGLTIATGILVAMRDCRRAPRPVWSVVLGALLAAAVIVPDTPDPFATGMARRYRDAGRIFMRHEGVQTTVSVHVRELGWRQLYLDGLHQASDGRDVVQLHWQIGHLPVLLHPEPKRALVIGLGGGATAGAVSLHPGLDVDVVELSAGVVQAAEWFTHINHGVVRRPNVRLHTDDARNFLLRGRHSYDVITADIIQPTHAGAGLLYSREYFELARRALSEDGVMVQWLGSRPDHHYKMIARTFHQVFPETTVWANGGLLIGAKRPLKLDHRAVHARVSAGHVRAALADAGLPDGQAVLASYTAGPDHLRQFLGPGPVLTDDKPMLEYYLSLPSDQRPVDLSGLIAR